MVYGTTGKPSVIDIDDESPEHWVSAKEYIELAVKQRDHGYYDVPEWAAEEFSKSKTLSKIKIKVGKRLKTGDYSKVSSIALRGRLKRSARAVQLFRRLVVLETHTLRY